MKKTQGFTLIELMIVVAIIAILAAIALPAYSDYTKKAKVSEVVLAASSLRTGVSEYVASNNALPGTDWNDGTGFTPTQYVSALEWDNGKIVATATGIDAAIDGSTIELTPTADTDAGVVTAWVCEGSIPSKFRPGSCQGAASSGT